MTQTAWSSTASVERSTHPGRSHPRTIPPARHRAASPRCVCRSRRGRRSTGIRTTRRWRPPRDGAQRDTGECRGRWHRLARVRARRARPRRWRNTRTLWIGPPGAPGAQVRATTTSLQCNGSVASCRLPVPSRAVASCSCDPRVLGYRLSLIGYRLTRAPDAAAHTARLLLCRDDLGGARSVRCACGGFRGREPFAHERGIHARAVFELDVRTRAARLEFQADEKTDNDALEPIFRRAPERCVG